MNSSVGRHSKVKSKARLLAEGLAPYILIALIGYTVSDVGIMSIRDLMLPQKAPPAKPPKPAQFNTSNKASYQSIISRNLFNQDGMIPDALALKANPNDPNRAGVEAPPVLSQLPLNLIGTVVLTKPEKSIANIEVKSKNMVIALMPNREIDNIATLVKVERNKAIIRNTNLGRLEYIEIKNQNKLSFNNPAPLAAPKGPGEVKQVAPNKYILKRETLLKHTSDLSSLLMQASTVPRRKANGDIECYILTSFKPDSIFADLGVNQGDCIKSVNGEPIDSPAKAMEIYNAFKTSSSIKLTVESDGRDVQKDYTIE